MGAGDVRLGAEAAERIRLGYGGPRDDHRGSPRSMAVSGTPEVMCRLAGVLEKMAAKSERESGSGFRAYKTRAADFTDRFDGATGTFGKWFRDFDRWKAVWDIADDVTRRVIVGKLLTGAAAAVQG